MYIFLPIRKILNLKARVLAKIKIKTPGFQFLLIVNIHGFAGFLFLECPTVYRGHGSRHSTKRQVTFICSWKGDLVLGFVVKTYADEASLNSPTLIVSIP